MVEAVENLTATLALIAAAGAILLLAARVLGAAVPIGQSVGRAVIAVRAELTFAVAGVAMAGSLYFSESAGFVPCRLCWFQRIAMYPIAVVALIALMRRDRAARWYIVPMAAIGAAISAYHVMIEQGWVNDSESCAAFGPSCADVWFESFGFVTLAMMALAGFVSIIVINTVSFEPRRLDSPASDHSEPEEKP
jgi:disulfide bond formation protein DsbB